MRQCKFGELRLLAAVYRPDIRAGLAKIAPRINYLRGSDVCRIHDLVRVAKEWRNAAAWKYASPSRPRGALDFTGKVMGKVRNGGGSASQNHVVGMVAGCGVWRPVN